MERLDPALVALEPPHPVPIRDARREGKPGQLVPHYELALADFARHLQLSARRRTSGAYLDALQRLLAFGLDPLQAERGELEAFLSRDRRGRWGDEEGQLTSSTQTAELGALRRFYRWARAEGLRPGAPTEGIRPPRREPYAQARGLSAEEVARLLENVQLAPEKRFHEAVAQLVQLERLPRPTEEQAEVLAIVIMEGMATRRRIEEVRGAATLSMGPEGPVSLPRDSSETLALLLSRGSLCAERDDHATGRPLVYRPTPRLLQLLKAETLEEARGRLRVAAPLSVPNRAELRVQDGGRIPSWVDRSKTLTAQDVGPVPRGR
ncbi:MAG: hypothetical protein JF922_02910 [Candidatus Dormibacteraeota bacterium]|uniref:Core-binding (CB) domain-containing protein n=1 Tax=Candidatus Nephthysia bennettiae TaxID=3127016 RepID=A0A934K7F8_9BACT|nr:hypothetical protein [Candidatus Dormibacteraeota bacterium]MBJ7613629.1 hypothetical protein [Candidatus Dormibacteraeota bacterium]